MIVREGILLEAAVKAGVPKFIPSDFPADFTKTRSGDNRNFDLRREFAAIADGAPIKVPSVLNGAFMDMLGAEMPIIQRRIRRVIYWHDADQLLDFTTKDDTATSTACVALDTASPRFLRIAGNTLSASDISRTLTELSGARYRPLWAGSLGTLGVMICIAKRLAPQSDDPFPAWQGMQYLRDLFSGRGKLTPLANDRYGSMNWTQAHDHLGCNPAFKAAE
jgi:hypothetical protein